MATGAAVAESKTPPCARGVAQLGRAACLARWVVGSDPAQAVSRLVVVRTDCTGTGAQGSDAQVEPPCHAWLGAAQVMCGWVDVWLDSTGLYHCALGDSRNCVIAPHTAPGAVKDVATANPVLARLDYRDG